MTIMETINQKSLMIISYKLSFLLEIINETKYQQNNGDFWYHLVTFGHTVFKYLIKSH